MTSPRTTSSQRLDLDEIALLEEERDHLLASLEDLEREFAAGDMDELDYRTLKDDYTVRAATVLEALDEQHRALRAAAPTRRPAVTVAIAAGVVAFAVVAGLFVRRAGRVHALAAMVAGVATTAVLQSWAGDSGVAGLAPVVWGLIASAAALALAMLGLPARRDS